MDDPRRPLPDPPPALVVRTVLWLHGALGRLARRLLPPEAYVFDTATGAARTYALRAAFRVGLFDALARRPGSTSAEVAAALGLDPDATHRFLRGMAAIGFVEVDAAGRFSNAAPGEACARDGGLRAFVEYFGSAANLGAWERVESALRTGKPAFEAANGRTVWAWFDEHPDELAHFAEAMAFLTRAEAAAIATAWPFSDRPDLCDVGGGRGTLAGEILVRHAAVRVTIVDRPAVLPHADRHLSERGVRDRATLAPADFFDAVPGGHAVYVLKNVLHDWDDERSVRILGNVRAACAPSARVLVVEERQEPLGLGPAALGDLQMLVVCDGGRERGEAEYAGLLERAGFRFAGSRPTGSRMVLFEGVAG